MSDEDSEDGTLRPKVSNVNDLDLYQKAISHMLYRKQLEGDCSAFICVLFMMCNLYIHTNTVSCLESTPEGCTFMPDTGLSNEFREKHALKHQDVEVTE
jgi:hypothetical protein